MEQRAREGDFLETFEGLIFDVKGLVHPPDRIIAYLRYYPKPNGRRIRDGIRYEKIYSIKDRYECLKIKYSQYLFHDKASGEMLQGIPKGKIKRIFHPEDVVKKLLQMRKNSEQSKSLSLVETAFDLVKLIQSQSGIDYNKIGITGSILVNLETEQSDIDLIIYGSKNAYRVKEALIQLQNSHRNNIQPYSRENLDSLYKFRGKNSGIQFKEFVKIEQRKKLQGIFKGTDFYIRCIKDWDEIKYKYGEIKYKNVGIVTIRGIITDVTGAIFTPCKYSIETSKLIEGIELSNPIREIVSFRGRFCEQAQKGEEIEARGKVELVNYKGNEFLRLLLGASENDYLRIMNYKNER